MRSDDQVFRAWTHRSSARLLVDDVEALAARADTLVGRSGLAPVVGAEGFIGWFRDGPRRDAALDAQH